MIIFPMVHGIRMIRVAQRPDTLRLKCADAAEKLRMEHNWSERGLRLYTVKGLIEAASK
jgi:hypothetical protein